MKNPYTGKPTTDQFLDQKQSTIRLFNEWKKYGQLIVAFEVDNTVFNIAGFPNDDVIQLLRQCKGMGFHLIMFTGADESRYDTIKYKCQEYDIPFDSINTNPDFVTWGSQKCFYNILLDSRAGLPAAYMQLWQVIYKIRGEVIKHMDENSIDF